MAMQVVNITPREEGQRLDRFLAKLMPGAPKSFFYKMMRKKNILINGKKAEGSIRIAAGDEVKLFISDETIAGFQGKFSTETAGTENTIKDLPGSMPDIIYEDDDIIVINKPAGLLSQKADKDDISVVGYINAYLNTSAGTPAFSAGICNRLDRNTSGLIVAGKTVKGLQWMGSMFRQRELKKYYLCIVKGKIGQTAVLSGYLVKHGNHNNVTITPYETKGSSKVITEYRPLQYGRLEGGIYTLLEVHLVTGKSHQIRAHLKSTGHPLVGDAKYGHKDVYHIFKSKFGLKHQLLHAWRLQFGDMDSIPDKYHGMELKAPLPEEFTDIMEGLGMDVDLLKQV